MVGMNSIKEIKDQLQCFFFGEKEEPEGFEDIKKWANRLWRAHPWALTILKKADTLRIARKLFYVGLTEQERAIRSKKILAHPLDWAIIRQSCSVMRNIISKRCEKMAGFSSFECLWNIAHRRFEKLPKNLKVGFFEEFHHLMLGVRGKSGIYYNENSPAYLNLKGRKAALARSDLLDDLSVYAECRINSYSTGLDEDVIAKRKKNRNRIIRKFNSSIRDWHNWKWQLKHVIRDEKKLSSLIELTNNEYEAIKLAKKNKLPFGITPYYCSLMDYNSDRFEDHAIRAQVIPSKAYIEKMIKHRKVGVHSADFMLESDTSPIEAVVRRYPRIAIFKPFDTCAQICVYCQRNWEIRDVLCDNALISQNRMDKALRWFKKHPSLKEILITGGDPFIMNDNRIEYILKEISKISHIKHIRFGTRTPVVLPTRITKNFISMIAKYHNPPQRSISIVTHFEHAYEITPEAAQAVFLLRKAGFSVYNQMVFTIENSRRFEAVATRLALKAIGVDPYYTFMMKGKEETNDMRVPVARALQEQKEESRLMPGSARTDETVYNVPRLGKNYIRGWQHHDIIMIMPNGSRVIEYHPWEKNISLTEVYVDKDIPIYDYLKRLAKRGEDLKDYESIWYYY